MVSTATISKDGIKTESTSQTRAGMAPSDFIFGSILGQGSFAKVYHAQFKKTNANFAIKVMDQDFIKKHRKVPFVVMERQVMSKLSHPNVVKFYCSFKDDESLYMVMELCRGGELLSYICNERDTKREQGLIDVACEQHVVQFYLAQLIVALEYIHSNNIIHRDLKPDNILLNDHGHLKVTDFGTATFADMNDPANNFCGTAEYLSPEVLNDEPACIGSDLWAVGCILFQMFVGRPPFRGENDYLTFQQILTHESDSMEFPSHVPETARDLCRKLLVRTLENRLTDYESIRHHPFFDGIQWETISITTPPILPPKTELPTPLMDGASPNWSLSNVLGDVFNATPIERNNIITNNQDIKYKKLLENNETILFESNIKLHGNLFLKKSRHLILTSNGNLIFYNIKNNTNNIIKWNNNIQIIPKNLNTFDIRMKTNTIRITDTIHGAQKWYQLLNNLK